MQNQEELAQEALKFLEIAQKHEEEKNAEKAISNYQKAAEFLKQSGYLMHRINDIYERIEELRKFLKQEQIYQQTQTKTQIEQLQDQAFAILEGAKKLEFDGFFEDAIKQYYSATKLLHQSGWSEAQLENLRLKIKDLTDTLRKVKSDQKGIERELSAPDQYLQEIEEIKPEVVGMFGQKSNAERADSISKYRERKKKEEEIQTHAFSHIDKAKKFEKEKKFDNAISNYERAIELLDSIGWTDQTQNILVIIDKLKKDKQQFEIFQDQQKQVVTDLLGSDLVKEYVSEPELKKEKLIEFEEKKKREERIQKDAFNLIDVGKRYEREKKYDLAIQKFENVIIMLESIEWDSYIQPIVNLIKDVQNKQERENQALKLQEKREKDLISLQESISKKQEEQLIENAKELEFRKRQFEEQRNRAAEKEKNFFSLLGNADHILQTKNYEEAINEYQKALKFIEELGPGWETYVSNINNTISNIQKMKSSQLTKQIQAQEKLEKREKVELDFQKQITNLLNKEREQLKQKEIVLKDKEKEITYLAQRKDVAFELLDT
ncbi:MAG: hypothetical protein ACXAEX_14515, partial [Promethearchaeota archaeon]